MSVATIELDNFWSIDNSRFSSAEDLTFLLIVAVILASAILAIVVPEQRRDTATTIDLRIEPAAPAEQQVAEIPAKDAVDTQLEPQLARQSSQEQPRQEPVNPGGTESAEKPEKRLDLSLPQIPAPFKQLGVIEKSPGSNLQPARSGRKTGEHDTSTTTDESYVSVFGDIEVRISERCTMILGSEIRAFDDGPKIAYVRCRKSAGKREIEHLFRDIRRRR